MIDRVDRPDHPGRSEAGPSPNRPRRRWNPGRSCPGRSPEPQARDRSRWSAERTPAGDRDSFFHAARPPSRLASWNDEDPPTGPETASCIHDSIHRFPASPDHRLELRRVRVGISWRFEDVDEFDAPGAGPNRRRVLRPVPVRSSRNRMRSRDRSGREGSLRGRKSSGRSRRRPRSRGPVQRRSPGHRYRSTDRRSIPGRAI